MAIGDGAVTDEDAVTMRGRAGEIEVARGMTALMFKPLVGDLEAEGGRGTGIEADRDDRDMVEQFRRCE